MILNTYAILDIFLSLLRLVLGLITCWLALRTWASWRRIHADPARLQPLEDRAFLVFLLAGALLVLNVLSWPVLFLLLQSYVSEWHGVMCIYGVTRIGTGSVNSSRFLPPLLAGLQASKPLLVYLSGAWFVLYLVNRRTAMTPLTGRILLIVLVASLLAVADAAAELTYLVIPKREQLLASGCCMGLSDQGPHRFIPSSAFGDNSDSAFLGFYAFVSGVMVFALPVFSRLSRGELAGRVFALIFLSSLISLAVFAIFLVDEAAPKLLHQPNHHCVYDLPMRAPRGFVAVVVFAASTLCVGWGCALGWHTRRLESRSFALNLIRIFFCVGATGYLVSLALLSVEFMLA